MKPHAQDPQEIEFAALVRQFYRRAGPEKAQDLLETIAECPTRGEMVREARRALEALPVLH